MAKISLRTWPERHKSPAFWVVTFFGSGLLKPAPGTWGSLAALIAGYGLLVAGTGPVLMTVLVAALTLVSAKLIDGIEAKTRIHDAPEIVIDEVAGLWLALLPLTHQPPHILPLIAAFLLFRVFDILKPWPICWLDTHVKGGLGVIVDDLVAGLFAAGILWFLMGAGLIA
ncbi:phosphatidylglycerophosphatase A family protein [Kordiimonas marina]|uniref:phosphatidylglycerophosphatase A family protein n=1 Tax=Kordiimonas marina TaxID=2872312 RepID=UPI001FF1CAAA|nr:phosphatidylglycerophosphatase A [Kordiimonas marina]MCJ9428790.1 phosphatidylglycerophosphatase A [Kordiimonas marina]